MRINFLKYSDLILLCLLISIPIYALIQNKDNYLSGEVAVVEISGKQRYSLSLNEEQQIILDEWKPPVILKISSNGIRIIENDCPAQICIQTGSIQNHNETIVCIPKKMLIYIQKKSSEQKSSEIKSITG